MTLLPDWPAPARVRALCSTRAGGVSAPPWDSLNLGDHVGDRADHVAANRTRYAELLGARPVFLRQVHGSAVVRVASPTPDGDAADACVSTGPGVACTIMVADCLPVLLCDVEGRAVAAAHAGWRGLAGNDGRGVLEATLDALGACLGEAAPEIAPGLLAWLGPCIGPDAFEVGAEVRAAFTAHDPGATALFRPHGERKWLADLPALARRRLLALGVGGVYGNDGTASWCTVGNPSVFFSHRRDGTSGRFAASIWLT
ncbi:peptidoglycan editing factor PgeF [Ramlibacter sp. AN1015]|uniref:peptidoglycan editing factor PgeF n=1 Tax=Ramlibacter sp. AN1015 TaxID=3133428 RepID=UPI0030BF5FCC